MPCIIDSLFEHRCKSKLVHIMVCYLMAPSHCLTQYCFIMNWAPGIGPLLQWNASENTKFFTEENAFENVYKNGNHFVQSQCDNSLLCGASACPHRGPVIQQGLPWDYIIMLKCNPWLMPKLWKVFPGPNSLSWLQTSLTTDKEEIFGLMGHINWVAMDSAKLFMHISRMLPKSIIMSAQMDWLLSLKPLYVLIFSERT